MHRCIPQCSLAPGHRATIVVMYPDPHLTEGIRQRCVRLAPGHRAASRPHPAPGDQADSSAGRPTRPRPQGARLQPSALAARKRRKALGQETTYWSRLFTCPNAPFPTPMLARAGPGRLSCRGRRRWRPGRPRRAGWRSRPGPSRPSARRAAAAGRRRRSAAPGCRSRICGR